MRCPTARLERPNIAGQLPWILCAGHIRTDAVAAVPWIAEGTTAAVATTDLERTTAVSIVANVHAAIIAVNTSPGAATPPAALIGGRTALILADMMIAILSGARGKWPVFENRGNDTGTGIGIPEDFLPGR